MPRGLKSRLVTNKGIYSPLVVFFGIAYAWAWIVFVPMVVFHAAPQWTILATLGPTVAAVVAHRVTSGNYRAVRIRTAWLRMLGATVLVLRWSSWLTSFYRTS